MHVRWPSGILFDWDQASWILFLPYEKNKLVLLLTALTIAGWAGSAGYKGKTSPDVWKKFKSEFMNCIPAMWEE